MKKILLAIIALSIFLSSPVVSHAASVEFINTLAKKEYLAESEISVPIHISSAEAYNAYTVTVEFENLEYIETTYDKNWTAINGPTYNNNSVTFTAALLGKDKYAIDNREVMTVVFKAPKEGSFKILGSGTVALTDKNATQISGEIPQAEYSVTSDVVKNTLQNLDNSQSLVYKIIRVAIVVVIVIVAFLLFRMRKLRPGRKKTF